MRIDKINVNIIIGPLLFVVCYLFLPHNVFPDAASRAAIGTVVWMAFWWVTGPVDYAVTAFLPIAVNAVIHVSDMSTVISNYASETILLLLGASVLSVSWEETGLDKRIAAKFLCTIGNDYRGQLIFWFLVSLILSAVLPNAVVCTAITPLAVAMLKYVGKGNIRESKEGAKLLLYIAYGTGIGGLASPLGGAMNLVTVSYLEQLTGEEYMYVSWVIRFFPIVVLITLITMFFMLRDVKKNETLGETKQYFIERYHNMPPISKEEILSLILFLVAVILSFTRELYQELLPELKPAYVFIICAILSFFITDKRNRRVMKWSHIQGKISWELMYIFAGGLAAGTLMNESGAVAALGDYVSETNASPGIIMIFVVITLTLIMSDITSNTATAAVAIPIVISVAQGLNTNPIPYIYIASIGVNLSFSLPTSIRAIPVGYGVSPKYMFSEGWKISVAIIALITVVCYLFISFWPQFSTV